MLRAVLSLVATILAFAIGAAGAASRVPDESRSVGLGGTVEAQHPAHFSSLRVCAYPAFSLAQKRCTKDQRARILISSKFACSVTVRVTRAKRLHARLKYAGAREWRMRFEEEKKPNVRYALAYGLAASGDLDYINNLANALDSRDKDQVEIYLYELGSSHGQLNELQRYLRSMNPKVRAGMARIIGNIGDPSSTDQIRALTDDTDTEVVREAVGALRKLSR